MHLRNKSHLCGSGKFVAENPGIQSPNIPLGLFSSLIFNQSPSPMKIKSLGSRSRSKSVNKLIQALSSDFGISKRLNQQDLRNSLNDFRPVELTRILSPNNLGSLTNFVPRKQGTKGLPQHSYKPSKSRSKITFRSHSQIPGYTHTHNMFLTPEGHQRSINHRNKIQGGVGLSWSRPARSQKSKSRNNSMSSNKSRRIRRSTNTLPMEERDPPSSSSLEGNARNHGFGNYGNGWSLHTLPEILSSSRSLTTSATINTGRWKGESLPPTPDTLTLNLYEQIAQNAILDAQQNRNYVGVNNINNHNHNHNYITSDTSVSNYNTVDNGNNNNICESGTLCYLQTENKGLHQAKLSLLEKIKDMANGYKKLFLDYEELREKYEMCEKENKEMKDVMVAESNKIKEACTRFEVAKKEFDADKIHKEELITNNRKTVNNLNTCKLQLKSMTSTLVNILDLIVFKHHNINPITPTHHLPLSNTSLSGASVDLCTSVSTDLLEKSYEDERKNLLEQIQNLLISKLQTITKIIPGMQLSQELTTIQGWKINDIINTPDQGSRSATGTGTNSVRRMTPTGRRGIQSINGFNNNSNNLFDITLKPPPRPFGLEDGLDYNVSGTFRTPAKCFHDEGLHNPSGGLRCQDGEAFKEININSPNFTLENNREEKNTCKSPNKTKRTIHNYDSVMNMQTFPNSQVISPHRLHTMREVTESMEETERTEDMEIEKSDTKIPVEENKIISRTESGLITERSITSSNQYSQIHQEESIQSIANSFGSNIMSPTDAHFGVNRGKSGVNTNNTSQRALKGNRRIENIENIENICHEFVNVERTRSKLKIVETDKTPRSRNSIYNIRNNAGSSIPNKNSTFSPTGENNYELGNIHQTNQIGEKSVVSIRNEKNKIREILERAVPTNEELELYPKAIAKHKFVGQKGRDLSFEAGNIISIEYKRESGWWIGILNGKRGFIPHNYIELLP